MVKLLKQYSLVALWCGVIFYLSSLQTVPTPKDTVVNFLLKKAAHMAEYAILYLLTYRAATKSKNKNTNLLRPFLFVVFFAATDEFHQYFVPGRHARLYDIGFDSLGALLVLLRQRNREFSRTR